MDSHELPDDDTGIEITNLDSTDRGHIYHEVHFSPRTRRWMVIITIVSTLLFLSFTFGSQLYSLVYKPPPPKLAANTNPTAISLQAVMNGVVYAVDPNNVFYAIRASNGSLISQNTDLRSVDQSISIKDITYTITSSGNVSATRSGDSVLLWSYQLHISFPFPLTVVDNRVYVTAGDGNVYALDAARGSLLWHYQQKTQIAQPVSAAGKDVYVPSTDGMLYALLASNGTLLWRHQLPVAAQLLTTPESVIYYSESNVTAFHANNGAVAWYLHLTATPVQPLVLANRNIYVAGFDNKITAFRDSNGSLLWQRRLPALAYEPIVVSDTTVYVHGNNYAIYTLNTSSGASLWSNPVKNIFTFTVVGETAYIVTIDSKVEALLPTGASLWQRQLPSSAIQPLIASEGVLYTATTAGIIYAIRASDSNLLWRYGTQFTNSQAPDLGITEFSINRRILIYHGKTYFARN